MSNSRILLVLLLFSLLLLPACQKGNPNAPASLSGKVTYKGSPVTGGQIGLYPKSGGNFIPIPLAPDGTYSATDLPVGDAVVTVETESINPEKKKMAYGGGRGGMSPAPENAQKSAGTYVKIPAKYADSTKTTLTVTLARGKQVKDLDLTD